MGKTPLGAMVAVGTVTAEKHFLMPFVFLYPGETVWVHGPAVALEMDLERRCCYYYLWESARMSAFFLAQDLALLSFCWWFVFVSIGVWMAGGLLW